MNGATDGSTEGSTEGESKYRLWLAGAGRAQEHELPGHRRRATVARIETRDSVWAIGRTGSARVASSTKYARRQALSADVLADTP